MKQVLLTATFVLLTLLGFSQAYKLDENKTYSYNDATANYDQIEAQFYSYANGGIKETSIVGIDFSTGENYYQINKSYNANNDITLTLNQLRDLDTEDWIDDSEIIYDYDLSNRLISETTHVFADPDDDFRVLYEYSGSLLIKRTTQVWDATNDDWKDGDKDEMTYINDLLDQQVSSFLEFFGF